MGEAADDLRLRSDGNSTHQRKPNLPKNPCQPGRQWLGSQSSVKGEASLASLRRAVHDKKSRTAPWTRDRVRSPE